MSQYLLFISSLIFMVFNSEFAGIEVSLGLFLLLLANLSNPCCRDRRFHWGRGGSMAGVVLEESGVGMSDEGNLSVQSQSSQSGEALVEWRSSEQLENGTQLTTAPYWDTDNDDDGGKCCST